MHHAAAIIVNYVVLVDVPFLFVRTLKKNLVRAFGVTIWIYPFILGLLLGDQPSNIYMDMDMDMGNYIQ